MNYDPFLNAENPEILRYEYAWVNFVRTGKIIDEAMRQEILDSWKRSKKYNIDYMMRELPQATIAQDDLSKRIKLNSELINTALPFMETLIEIVDEIGISIQIIDNEGYLLRNLNNSNFISDNELVFPIGSSINENIIGTTACGLSLISGKPIDVVGAEHYCQIFQKNASYAAPIFDRDERPIAILSMIGQINSLSKYTLGMIVAAAKAIENELQLKEIHSQILNQNIQQDDIINTVAEGIIYINSKNIITQANNVIAQMAGVRKEDLIGNSVSMLQTSPKIIGNINTIEGASKIKEIRIVGKLNSYNCFLNLRFLTTDDKEDLNRILVFTKMAEIQEMATQLNAENRAYFTFGDIVGKSNLLEEAIDLGRKAASHGTRIIIEGESGTGKEMFAQAIHNSSKRRNGPFIAVDCGAIPRELLESELFGYEEGAYTGARKGGHRGKFELANGGTLFLDEIGNMPFEMQVKLLRVLQENRIVRIGGYVPIPIDVQIISASNSDLKQEVEHGNFREDLLYRLNVIHIKLPALRERKSDIPTLINHYLLNSNNIQNKNKRIGKDVQEILMKYNWPGNVRQLYNVIERMLIMSQQETININVIPKDIMDNSQEKSTAMIEIESLEKATARYIKNILDSNNGNIRKAADVLQVSRSTIYRILGKNGLI
ncbi:MAG: sigma 54-interacting transcriptional regulator [Eubacteriales bacterium]